MVFLSDSVKISYISSILENENWYHASAAQDIYNHCQVTLAGTLTGVHGDIRCKVLAALSTVKELELELA